MVDIYRVQLVSQGVAGSPYYTTFHFLGASGSPAQAAADAAGFWGAVDAYMDSSLIWDLDTAVETIESTTGNIVGVTDVPPASGTGGTTGDVLPPATQALVRWRTGQFVGGREIRGKTFLPAIGEINSVEGQPASAMTTGIENAALALFSSPNSQLVVYSRKNGQAAPVTAASLWSEFAVLRSRRD